MVNICAACMGITFNEIQVQNETQVQAGEIPLHVPHHDGFHTHTYIDLPPFILLCTPE